MALFWSVDQVINIVGIINIFILHVAFSQVEYFFLLGPHLTKLRSRDNSVKDADGL